jgi:hypothetical protein
MAQCYPETEETPEAAEGTASHEIAAQLIQDAARGFNGGKWADWEGKTAPNGVVYTEEMFDGAKLYADDVAMIMRERSVFGGPSLGVEQRLEAPRIHELSFGTCDCFLFDRKTGELFIWDYKFGYELVEAFENWQSINYAAGIFDQFGVNGLEDQITTVRIRIAQPRAFHREGPIREWKVKGSDLRGYFNQLHAGAHKALGPNAECNTGPHCKHCPGRHACEAAITAGARLFEAASKPVPVELSDAALGVQLSLVKRARKHLEYLESGFEEQVAGRMRAGALIPGWGREDTYGRDKWDKPFEEVIAMGEMFGQDLRKKEPITPKQAIKLGVDEAVIKAYSSQPRTGVKIVPDNGNKAKQVFSQ